jgi:hypothetical protein
MPNVRGDKRRTFVCPDELWDELSDYAEERGLSRGAVLRSLLRWAMRPENKYGVFTESDEAPAELV